MIENENTKSSLEKARSESLRLEDACKDKDELIARLEKDLSVFRQSSLFRPLPSAGPIFTHARFRAMNDTTDTKVSSPDKSPVLAMLH